MLQDQKPLVSVIISTYNDSKYIYQALQSISSQTYTNLEIIVVNDASTDNTLDILQKYKTEDTRVIIINNKNNCKLAHNLNKAIELAKGIYIARMDADDISESQRIEIQVEFLENNRDIDVVGTYAQQFGDSDFLMKYPIKHEDIKAKLLFENVICHPAVMFRKNTLDFRYDESCQAGQDYELWSRIIWTKKFATIPKVLFRYRIHKNQTKNKNGVQQKSGAIKARKKILKQLDPNQCVDQTVFLSIFDLNQKKNKHELKNIEQTLKKLIALNDERNLFNKKIFTKECYKSYFWNWYISVGNDSVGIRDITEGYFSEFYKKENIHTKIKSNLKMIRNRIKSVRKSHRN